MSTRGVTLCVSEYFLLIDGSKVAPGHIPTTGFGLGKNFANHYQLNWQLLKEDVIDRNELILRHFYTPRFRTSHGYSPASEAGPR